MKTIPSFLCALTCSVTAVLADPIAVADAYARSGAKSGAAFFTILNTGTVDDRLVGVSSDVARRTELHTHIMNDQGVMRMVHVEDGFAIPAGGEHQLARGGDHVMLMGLATPLEQGGTVTITLEFEVAGEISIEIPVDNDRKASHKHNH